MSNTSQESSERESVWKPLCSWWRPVSLTVLSTGWRSVRGRIARKENSKVTDSFLEVRLNSVLVLPLVFVRTLLPKPSFKHKPFVRGFATTRSQGVIRLSVGGQFKSFFAFTANWNYFWFFGCQNFPPLCITKSVAFQNKSQFPK